MIRRPIWASATGLCVTGVVVALVAIFIFCIPRFCIPREQLPVTRKGLGIADLLRDLKVELTEAQKSGPAFLKLQSIDVEANFVVRTGSTKKGDISVEIVTLEQEIAEDIERIHKLSLHLTAVPMPEEQAPLRSTQTSGDDEPLP